MEKPSPEKWEKIEEKVGEAEKAERQKLQTERELYEETGITKTGREKLKEKEIIEKAGRRRVAEKALEREKVFEEEAENILGPEGSPERALVGLRKMNLISALQEERAINSGREKLLQEEAEILKGTKERPSGSELEALEEVRKEIAGFNKKKEALLKSTPEAYFGLHLKELKGYKKDLEKGRIVETAYVKEQVEDIAAHLRAGKPILLYGHLGSGKTEIARHVAQKYIGKKPEVISGSKHTTIAELYGHQVLKSAEISKDVIDKVDKEIIEQFSRWTQEHPGANDLEKNNAHYRIVQTHVTQLRGGTISDFFIGPIYRAMEDGRPIIIDEVNAIPHETLISLNDILTRKIGETAYVQQNTGTKVKIKEGFGVIMTGNLNQGQEKYIDRQDMDPAFLSRLYKLEYDYLPQKTEGALEDEAGKENELFHLLLTKTMDKNGNIEAPKDAIKKLWNLAKAARVTQDVFAGKEIQSAYYFQEAGGRAAKYLLKESVLSIRAVDNILTQWQKEGYKYELDHYLWKEFVSQSTIASDKAYLYQLFKDRFNFFQSNGWEQNPNYGKGGVVNVFDIKAPQNPSAEKEFFGPRETVESAFGKAPERAKWPEALGAKKEKEELNLEELEELTEFQDSLEKDLEELGAGVEETCKL